MIATVDVTAEEDVDELGGDDGAPEEAGEAAELGEADVGEGVGGGWIVISTLNEVLRLFVAPPNEMRDASIPRSVAT